MENKVWVVFRLNDVPIQTEREGFFNCLALMDAASGEILGTELVPVLAAVRTSEELVGLLRQGQDREQRLPKALWVESDSDFATLSRALARKKVEVALIPESELIALVGEARKMFSERFGESQ